VFIVYLLLTSVRGDLSKRSKFFDEYERHPDLGYYFPRDLGREKRNIHTDTH